MGSASYSVVTFYKFVELGNCSEIQPQLLAFCNQHSIKGTILLAREGINGTISGSEQSVQAVFAYLSTDSRLSDLQYRVSIAPTAPFDRMKVKVKPEIVTLGLPEVNPAHQVGIYVDPEPWNGLLEDPEVLVIDTRNAYEVHIGTFEGAIQPNTHTFREFPNYVQQHLDPHQHSKIALFCTGGIRCEKATSFLLSQGFQQVYHLHGGILRYLAEVSPQESRWRGECFVFDERVAVHHGLELGHYDLCRSCGYPISALDKRSPQYREGICCPYCVDQLTEEKLRRQQERQKQWELHEKNLCS